MSGKEPSSLEPPPVLVSGIAEGDGTRLVVAVALVVGVAVGVFVAVAVGVAVGDGLDT
jgi:hypothetical protein